MGQIFLFWKQSIGFHGTYLWYESSFHDAPLTFTFPSGVGAIPSRNRLTAGPLDIGHPRGEDSSLIHFSFEAPSASIYNSNPNLHPKPTTSTSPPLTSTLARNLVPFITPPPELRLRQSANGSRSLQQANATAQQSIQQASISASAAIQQVSDSASNAIAAVLGSSSSAVAAASLAMASLQSSSNAALGSASVAMNSASASLMIVQVKCPVWRNEKIVLIYDIGPASSAVASAQAALAAATVSTPASGTQTTDLPRTTVSLLYFKVQQRKKWLLE
jgi:hypothetical protein